MTESNNNITDEDKSRPIGNRMKPYDFLIGKGDNDHVNIEKIYASSKDFVVYRTKFAIRIDLDDDSPKLDLLAERHYKIGMQLARIYSWLPQDLSNTENLNRLISRAITMNLAGCHDEAKKVLAHAEERLVKLMQIQGRLTYTFSAFACVLFVLLGVVFAQNFTSELLPKIILCGAIGGFLSIAIGYERLRIDIDANKTTNILIGFSRIIIAVIASIFLYFAVQSEIAFSFVRGINNNNGYYLVGIIAGFAEMLVPNIVNNLAGEKRKIIEESFGNFSENEIPSTKNSIEHKNISSNSEQVKPLENNQSIVSAPNQSDAT